MILNNYESQCIVFARTNERGLALNIAAFFQALALWATYHTNLNIASRNDIIHALDIRQAEQKWHLEWKDALDDLFGVNSFRMHRRRRKENED
jgi:hypothetical protein